MSKYAADGIFITKDGSSYKVMYQKSINVKELRQLGKRADNLNEAMELADLIFEDVIELGKVPINGIMVVNANGTEEQ